MPWCKFFMSGIILSLSVGAAQATTVCPQYPTQQDKTHALNDASLFVGPPKDLVELMPDYQDEAKEHKTSLYFICHYKNTKQSVELIVPATAKKCSVAYDKNRKLIAACE